MSPLTIHRPKTLGEALSLLARGLPLAGGIDLATRRDQLSELVDLRDLDLNRIQSSPEAVRFGASVKLQAIVEAREDFPDALREACRLEAAWNVRNVATVAGMVMTADGRSPCLTVLLALDVGVVVEPGGEQLALGTVLDRREGGFPGRLISGFHFQKPRSVLYEQVSRTPFDRPLVGAAVTRWPAEGGGEIVRVVLNGYGSRPERVVQAEEILSRGGEIEEAVGAVEEAYRQAEDAWASAEYRVHAAQVLVRRLWAWGAE